MLRHAPLLVVASCAAVALVAAQEPLPGDADVGSGVAPSEPVTVALLPTVYLSDDLADPAHHEQMLDALRRKLATLDGLSVIGPDVTAMYSGVSMTPVEIGRELGAKLVLESSVTSGASGTTTSFRVHVVESGDIPMSWGHTAIRDARRQITPDHLERIAARAAESIEQLAFPHRRPDLGTLQADATTVFLDTTRAEKERIEALQSLAGPRSGLGYPPEYVDGGAALSGEVAAVAAQLGIESEDAGVRGQVWDIMAGVRDSALVEPLLYSLANDSEPWVRIRAAQALGTHIDEPVVRDSLAVSSRDDLDAGVRQAAHLVQLSPGALFDEMRRTLMDDTLPTQDRRMALYRIMQVNEKYPQTIDGQLRVAIVEFAKRSPDASERQSAWFCYAQLVGAESVGDIIAGFAVEPSDAVREGMVSALGRYRNEPGVLDAIADAHANDPSPQVREAAGRVLREE